MDLGAAFSCSMESIQGRIFPINYGGHQQTPRSLGETFYEYQRDFEKILTELRAAGGRDVVSAKELLVWVKKGLKNQEVFLSCTSGWYLEHPDATYDQVFKRVNDWLSEAILIDKDPYHLSNTITGKISANSAEVNNYKHHSYKDHAIPKGANNSRTTNNTQICTRCWHTGHKWMDCRSYKCHATGCASSLSPDDRGCPNWRRHVDPKHRYRNDIVPWERKAHDGAILGKRPRNQEDNTMSQKNTSIQPTVEESMENLKLARKQLRAAKAAAKKKN